MNTDELLRSADPVSSRRLDDNHVQTLLTSTRWRRDVEPAVVRSGASRWRPVAVGAVAAVLVGGVVAAVAVTSSDGAGTSAPPAVTSATVAVPPDVTADLQRLLDPDALVDQARPLIVTGGPEGSTVTLWTAPASGGRTCQAVRIAPPAATPSTYPVRPCEQPAVVHGMEMGRWQWTSPTTGRVYDGLWGGTGPAVTQVQLLADGRVVSDTPVAEGMYLTGGVADDDTPCRLEVRGIDADGAPSVPSFAFGRDCGPTATASGVSGR